MKNIFRNKTNIIIGLCAVVILMGIGFSAFSQRLEIGDTVTTSSDWNVYIKSVETKTFAGKGAGSGEIVDRASAKLTANLSSPGDSVTYTITVANDGNIDAVLDVITLSASNSDSVIKYSYSGIAEDEELPAKTETSFVVKIEYDSLKTGTATTAQKQNTLTLDLDYIQKGSGTNSPSLTTVNVGGNDVILTTSGDGLYVDLIDEDRYIYKGADPDNYIWLDLNGDTLKTDNENYRIVAIEADNTIKVVAQNMIEYMAWDTQSTRYFEVSTDFCNSTSGCKIWGNNKTTLDSTGNNFLTQFNRYPGTTLLDLPVEEASLNTYLNTTFLESINQNLQNKITTHLYNVGFVRLTSGQTLAEDVAQEKTLKWRGKIALINASDYMKATTNSLCTGYYEYRNNSECYSNSETHNYLFNSTGQWTLTSFEGSYSSNSILCIKNNGGVDYNSAYLNSHFQTHPSFHLTSNVILSGKGTKEEPYAIAS